jgi:hypothetical protein
MGDLELRVAAAPAWLLAEMAPPAEPCARPGAGADRPLSVSSVRARRPTQSTLANTVAATLTDRGRSLLQEPSLRSCASGRV